MSKAEIQQKIDKNRDEIGRLLILNGIANQKCDNCSEVGNWQIILDDHVCVSDACIKARLETTVRLKNMPLPTEFGNIPREIADKYQDLFNFLNQEHDLLPTIEQMDEVILEVDKFKAQFDEEKSQQERDVIMRLIGRVISIIPHSEDRRKCIKEMKKELPKL